jgi:hypothetical protein
MLATFIAQRKSRPRTHLIDLQPKFPVANRRLT